MSNENGVIVAIDLVIFGIRKTIVEEVETLDLCVLLEQYEDTEEWVLPGSELIDGMDADQVAKQIFDSVDSDTDNKPVHYKNYTAPDKTTKSGQRVVSLTYRGMIEHHHVDQAEDGTSRRWFPKDDLPDFAKGFGAREIIEDVYTSVEGLPGRESVVIALDLLPELFFVRDARSFCALLKGDKRAMDFGMYARLLEKGKDSTRESGNPLFDRIKFEDAGPVKPLEGKGRPARRYEKVRRIEMR
jgi:hypothetical protein